MSSPVDVFPELIRHCLDLLELQAVIISTSDGSGGLSTVATSSTAAGELANYESKHQNGPTSDCYRDGVVLPFLNLRQIGGWPEYSREAVAAGYSECSCLPMRVGANVIGVTQLFGQMDSSGLRVAAALCHVSTIAMLAQDDLERLGQRTLPLHPATVRMDLSSRIDLGRC